MAPRVPQDSPSCVVLDHKCKKRASWVGFTTPGSWVPPPLNKLATSAYLSRSSSVLRHGVAAVSAVGSPSSAPPSSVEDFPLGGAHGCPSRVPLVRNSWASWLDGFGSEPVQVLGLSGLSNFVVAAAGMGLGLSNGSSLSLRLLVVPLGVNTRRGGRRIVLVFMALCPHATSLPNHPLNKTDTNSFSFKKTTT
ncbi:hypothetical protein CR513_39593, partial [Mucuna pruriens]